MTVQVTTRMGTARHGRVREDEAKEGMSKTRAGDAESTGRSSKEEPNTLVRPRQKTIWQTENRT